MTRPTRPRSRERRLATPARRTGPLERAADLRNRLALVYGARPAAAAAAAAVDRRARRRRVAGARDRHHVPGGALFPVYYNVLSSSSAAATSSCSSACGPARPATASSWPSHRRCRAWRSSRVPAASPLSRRPRPACRSTRCSLAVAVLLSVGASRRSPYWTAAWTRSAESAQLTSDHHPGPRHRSAPPGGLPGGAPARRPDRRAPR